MKNLSAITNTEITSKGFMAMAENENEYDCLTKFKEIIKQEIIKEMLEQVEHFKVFGLR